MKPPTPISTGEDVTVRAHFCVPDEQETMLPRRRRAPRFLPGNAPLPRVDELVYLSSTSVWRVVRLVHEWRSIHELRIQVWIEYEGSGHHVGPRDFMRTQ